MLKAPDVTLPPERLAQLEAMAQRCEEEWGDAHLFWFTDHGPRHSSRVMGLIQEFIDATPGAAWTESELFILAAACLLHDVGMQHLGLTDARAGEYTATDWEKLRSEHAQVSFALVRADYEHALGMAPKKRKRSREKRRPLTAHHLNLGITEPAVGRAIALTCRGHSGTHFRDVCERHRSTPLEPLPGVGFRGDLVAAVLLLADEMDLHNARANIQDLEQYSPETRLHHLKHHYVDGAHFCATEKGVGAQVSMSFPHCSPWMDVFKNLVSLKLETEFRLLEDVLLASGIRLVRTPQVATSIEAEGDGFKLGELSDCDVAYAKQTLLKRYIANERDAMRALAHVMDTGGPLDVKASEGLAADEFGSDMLMGQVLNWLSEYGMSGGSQPVVVQFGQAGGAATDLADVLGSILSAPHEEVLCTTGQDATQMISDALSDGFVVPPVILVDSMNAGVTVRDWVRGDLLSLAIAEGFPLVFLGHSCVESDVVPAAPLVTVSEEEWHAFARSWGMEPSGNPDLASALGAAGASYGAGWYAVRVCNAQLAEEARTPL